MKLCTVILAFSLVLSPVCASAQQHSVTAPPRLVISERVLKDALAMEQPPIRESRDSVKNGALIGAIIGGIAMGGFVGWLCNMLQEPSDPSCLPPSLLYTGVGAGIGAAAGAGIDALMFRSPRFPLVEPPRRK